MTLLTRRPVHLVALVLLTGPVDLGASAKTPDLATDGWHTWRVDAAKSAEDRCCYTWNRGTPERKSCDLDSRHPGHGSFDNDDAKVEQMQIYALTIDGNVKKIHALNARCPVTTDRKIIDLGVQSTDDSVEWLQQYIDPFTELSSQAMVAISVHHGDRPIDTLIDVVRRNSNFENRKEAMFSLAMSDSDRAFEFLDRLLSKR